MDYKKLISPLISLTGQGSTGRHVLVLQDTTEINYAHHSGYLKETDDNLGPTGNNKDIGFFLHPCLVIDTATGMLLGASDVYIWNRQYGKENKYERNYANQLIEDKESYRWIACGQRSKEVLSKAASILFVADREADIYQEFIELSGTNSDVLIRSKSNRRLYGTEEKLYEYLRLQPVAGKLSLKVRPSKTRQQREALLDVRFSTVQVCRPVKTNSALPEYIQLNAIIAEESPDSVPKGEKAISWILLTTCSVTTLTDALKMINNYALRWQIELVFGSMKSKGIDIESSQLETGKALKSLAAMTLITAIQVNQLRLGRDEKGNIMASIMFTPKQIVLLKLLVKKFEGKTEKQKNPHKKETLAWAAWVIARMGGWKGYSSESPPGNKTMLWGYRTFNDIYQGWTLAL